MPEWTGACPGSYSRSNSGLMLTSTSLLRLNSDMIASFRCRSKLVKVLDGDATGSTMRTGKEWHCAHSRGGECCQDSPCRSEAQHGESRPAAWPRAAAPVLQRGR